MSNERTQLLGEHHSRAAAPARLLVVDDDPAFAHALTEFLHGEGYQVDSAADGAHARTLLANTRYHLVFAGLSRTSAGMLLGMIHQWCPEVVVLVITSFDMLARAAAAVRRGALAYLIKPLIDDEIRVAIQQALEQQRLLSGSYRLRRQLAAVRPGYARRRPPVRMRYAPTPGDGTP